MRAVLPGISPRDPLSFVAVALALGLVAVVALWAPARRKPVATLSLIHI